MGFMPFQYKTKIQIETGCQGLLILLTGKSANRRLRRGHQHICSFKTTATKLLLTGRMIKIRFERKQNLKYNLGENFRKVHHGSARKNFRPFRMAAGRLSSLPANQRSRRQTDDKNKGPCQNQGFYFFFFDFDFEGGVSAMMVLHSSRVSNLGSFPLGIL